MTAVDEGVTWTPKGQRTRARIVDVAASLIYQRGVVGTTLEDVRLAAQVSNSQLYHYFANKEQLVLAVIERHVDNLIAVTETADLSTGHGLVAWREMIITRASQVHGRGGCPLGSLGGQLVETDAHARTLIAGGFDRWSTAIRDGMRARHRAGHLAAGVNPDDLALTVLAALQGGLLLAQVHRDVRPLQTALDTVLVLAGMP